MSDVVDPVRSRNMWYVYVLSSKKNGQWYIGSTKNLRKRIFTHNAGKNKSTKHAMPWRIIYLEIGLNVHDARARERYLKSGMGRRYLKNRMKFFFSQTSNGVEFKFSV